MKQKKHAHRELLLFIEKSNIVFSGINPYHTSAYLWQDGPETIVYRQVFPGPQPRCESLRNLAAFTGFTSPPGNRRASSAPYDSVPPST